MANFSVNLLKEEIGIRGLAQANRYEILLPTTTVINTVANDGSGGSSAREIETFNTFCRAVNMPGKQILSVDRTVNGTFQKIAYGYAAEDVAMTFQSPSDLMIKEYFEFWQNKAFDMTDASKMYHKPRYKSEYAHDVQVWQIDKHGFKTYGVLLMDAYPTTVNAVSFADASENTPTEISVQLAYRKWTEIKDDRL